MMKQKWMKKSAKVFAGILAAAMVMAGMTACGSKEDVEESTSTVQESLAESVAESSEPESSVTETTQEAPEETVTYSGEITAIDGNSVTVALANMTEQTERQSTEEAGAAETMTIVIDEAAVITINGEVSAIDGLKVGDKVVFEQQGDKVISLTAGDAVAVSDDAEQPAADEASLVENSESSESDETSSATE